MNNVVLIGRLTRDPEIRYGQSSGQETCRFTLAVDRPKSQNQQAQTADFISCVAFDRMAETIGQYMAKGAQMGVEGRIRTGSYTKQDGTTAYTTDVVVNRAEFLNRGNSANDGRNQQGYTNTPPAPQNTRGGGNNASYGNGGGRGNGGNGAFYPNGNSGLDTDDYGRGFQQVMDDTPWD